MGDSRAAVGNRIAAAMLAFEVNDGSNEQNSYVDTGGYVPSNNPLIIDVPRSTMWNRNRWQPLAFSYALTQNGLAG